MELVRLTKEEQDYVTDCGTKIFNNKMQYHIKDGAVATDRNPAELDIMGVAGEYAASKYLGLPFTCPLFKVRDACDLKVWDYKIEVKTQSKVDLLNIPERQKDKAIDLYILVKRKFNIELFEIVGWIWRKDFDAKSFEYTHEKYKKKFIAVSSNDLEHPQYLKSCIGLL